MAQPYAAYPPQGGYYPPGYDYSGYYQQAYDPNQAYWQQYGYGAGQPPASQQPQPPQAPPLPADEPPPLPPDDATKSTTPAAAAAPAAAQAGAEAGAASAAPPPPPPPATEQGQGTTAAGSGSAAPAAPPAQAPQQQQQQQATSVAPGAPQTGSNAAMAASHYAQCYASYDAGYYGGGYGPPPHSYGAPGGYGPHGGGYGYPPAYGYGPPANSSYAPQVHQQHNTPYPPSSAPPPGPAPSTQAPSAPGAAAAASGSTASPSKPSRWNRAPPPACLTAGTGRPSTIKPATIVPASGAAAAGNLDAAQVQAARQAAAAAAARIAAGQHSGQQQQFISVGSTAGAAAGGAGTAGAAGAGASSASQALPASFTQYVHRALLRVTGAPAKQEQLKEVLRTMIADHRKAGTMWSTDWDRAPLPAVVGDGGSSPPTGGRSSVFTRIASSPTRAGGGGGWDRGAAADRGGGSGGYKSSSYREGEGSDDEDDSRGGYGSRYSRGEGGYGSRYGGSFSPRGSNRQGRSSKRGWDDGGSRYGNSDDSDDERSDSRGDEDDGGWRGNSKWGKKKQRLETGAGSGGRGKGGRGRKGQQQGGRGGRGSRGGNNQHLSPADAARAAARNARFQAAGGAQLAAYGWEDDGAGGDTGFIVGTCQKLEKGYLRLTRPPAPEEVRPQPVLSAALSRLLGLVSSKGDKYLYYNDQFKAMRQDLTVQGIKNDFTVQVYEAHARAALEYGDNAEYNQCQAQLAILYAKGLPGSHAEFGAYRLLYQAVYAQHGEGRKLLGTLRQLLGNRVGQVADSPEVAHAMQVRQALANGNVLRFFALYASAPRLSRRLMDAAVNNLRFKALSALVRTHKPTVILLPFLARALGFLAQSPAQASAAGAAGAAAGGGEGDEDAMDVDEAQQQVDAQLAVLTVDAAGKLLPGCSEQRCLGDHMPSPAEPEALAACLEWCKRHGAAFDQETDLPAAALVTKECWNRLFVPVDTSKVAHGDANLDIRDFLASVN